jgi:hypothetical protein
LSCGATPTTVSVDSRESCQISLVFPGCLVSFLASQGTGYLQRDSVSTQKEECADGHPRTVPGYLFVQHLGTTSSGSRSAVRYERVHVTSIAEQLSHLSEFSSDLLSHHELIR